MNQKNIKRKLNKVRGLIDECLVEIDGPGSLEGRGRSSGSSQNEVNEVNPQDLDFSMLTRAFMKKYGRSLSNGSKKFTLLLVSLVKADLEKAVSLADIEKDWNRMKVILGGSFNRFYSQAAKEEGWVTVKEKGFYSLKPSWVEIFQ